MNLSCTTIPTRKPDAASGHPLRRHDVGAVRPALALGEALPTDFPNALRAPEPLFFRRPVRKTWIFGLLLLCLIPRLQMIPRLGSICPDGVLYIRLAQALDEGRFQEGFREMKLNLYPLVLAGLHRLGLDWTVAGTLWGTAIATLTVLPLYGWIRRQYDETTALLAGILYAVHPVFIQWSVELIRDPTFWFFFALTLYLFWRAVTEVRWRWYSAAGLSLTLAVLTRFEGFILLIPVVLWAFWRWRALKQPAARRRLVGGTLVTVLAFPLLILVVNLIWLQRYDNWLFSRVAPLVLVQEWWQGMVAGSPPPPGTPPEAQTGVPLFRMVSIFVPNMVKGFSPLFGLLLLGGILKWPKVWLRRDHQPLFLASLAMFSAAWIHAWCAHESCERYFLSAVLMGAPFAALALRALIRWFPRRVMPLIWHPWSFRLAGMVPVLAVGIFGFAAALNGPYARRAAEVELARWIRQQYGAQATLFGSGGVTSVVGFYAQLPWTVLRRDMNDDDVLEHLSQQQPDVVLVLNTRRKDTRATERLIERIETRGFRRMNDAQLPQGIDHALIVIVRESDSIPMACRPVKESAASRIP
ncbi:MAG: glycosyltransferase family 39 protein [Pirellulales bacterium]|nr:glycosyltransferase family 39 protein [Pirellulales bacterium]